MSASPPTPWWAWRQAGRAPGRRAGAPGECREGAVAGAGGRRVLAPARRLPSHWPCTPGHRRGQCLRHLRRLPGVKERGAGARRRVGRLPPLCFLLRSAVAPPLFFFARGRRRRAGSHGGPARPRKKTRPGAAGRDRRGRAVGLGPQSTPGAAVTPAGPAPIGRHRRRCPACRAGGDPGAPHTPGPSPAAHAAGGGRGGTYTRPAGVGHPHRPPPPPLHRHRERGRNTQKPIALTHSPPSPSFPPPPFFPPLSPSLSLLHHRAASAPRPSRRRPATSSKSTTAV